jgi:ribosomal protein S18 acetylase RimI-like enzyme
MPHEMPHAIALRAATPDDEPFLRALYASTREEELAAVGWSPEQREAFLDMQFRARDAHYRQHYPDADDRIVLAGGVPAGRLDVVREGEIIRVIDIAVLPEFRGRGIGTHLLTGVIEEALTTGVPVELYVEFNNPAGRLYERLGFVKVGELPPYLRLEWQPSAGTVSRT